MTSRVLNFLWLNLDLPAKPDPQDGSIRQPLPPKYIENVRAAGKAHPGTRVNLWVDSRRLTKRQFAFLKAALEDKRRNVHLKDLRAIPAYSRNTLYNKPETDADWRSGGQTSTIWRQVDAAKILVSLQGNYGQSFFADLDHAHLAITSRKVQRMLKKHGLMIGGDGDYEYASIENQLWGFAPRRRKFFEQYYRAALKSARNGDNAWQDLVDKVDRQLTEKEGIPLQQICLPINDDGTEAEHPGHSWRRGWGNEDAAPELVDSGALARAFGKKIKAGGQDVPAETAPPAGPGAGFLSRAMKPADAPAAVI